MKKLIIILLLALSFNGSAQYYPNPLPSSGLLSMWDVINWMQEAGELGGTAPPYNLTLVYSRSRLTGTDIRLSRWYGYARVTTPVSVPAGFLISGSGQVSMACSTSVNGNYYIEEGTSVSIGNTVYGNSSLTNKLSDGSFKTSDNKVISVNSDGVITAISNC